MAIIKIIEQKPEDINLLNINKKCEKCGYIHTYEEVFRSDTKYAILHIMVGFCPKCDNWNKFSLIIDERGNILTEEDLKK